LRMWKIPNTPSWHGAWDKGNALPLMLPMQVVYSIWKHWQPPPVFNNVSENSFAFCLAIQPHFLVYT
jgi:hypothetical protein